MGFSLANQGRAECQVYDGITTRCPAVGRRARRGLRPHVRWPRVAWALGGPEFTTILLNRGKGCMNLKLVWTFGAVSASLLLSWSAVISGSPNNGSRDQVATVGAIRCLLTAIESYQHDHPGVPPSIKSLVPDYLLRENPCPGDGWGKALQYYSSRGHYVIMSFGKNGVPDPQVSPLGGSGHQMTLIKTLF